MIKKILIKKLLIMNFYVIIITQCFLQHYINKYKFFILYPLIYTTKYILIH